MSSCRGTSGSIEPSLCTLVLGGCGRPAPLPLQTIGRIVRCASGWFLSTVRTRVAKRTLASSRATPAVGRPVSRISVVLGIVLQAGKIPLAAVTRALLHSKATDSTSNYTLIKPVPSKLGGGLVSR